jgi:hypothetical protein
VRALATKQSEKAIVDKPIIAIVLSFLGGVFNSVAGLLRSMFGFFGSSMMERFGSMGEFMKGSRSFSHMMNNPWSIPLVVVGLTAGLTTMAGAFMLDYRVEKRRNWAILILACSTVGIISAFISGGSISGLYVGSILGIVGGVLAFFWKSSFDQST